MPPKPPRQSNVRDLLEIALCLEASAPRKIVKAALRFPLCETAASLAAELEADGLDCVDMRGACGRIQDGRRALVQEIDPD